MQIKILSKSQVQAMIDNETRKSETRMLKILERMRKRILELELKNLKGGEKNARNTRKKRR